LRENGLGAKSASCLALILGRNSFYSVLDLSGNRLRDSGAEQLAALLEVNDTIVHMALKSNDIGSLGAEHLASALLNNVTLTSLDLSGLSGINRNHLGTQGARAFGQALASNRTLAILNLGANGLGNEGLGHIAVGMEVNPTLTDIDLGSNNLGWEACTVLGPLLQSSNIKVLNLERNELKDKGAIILAQALRRENEARGEKDGSGGVTGPGVKVQSLNLAYNNIRTVGFRHVAEMIALSKNITTLRLDGNEPSDSSAELAQAIQENQSLTTLTLCKCEIMEESAAEFGKMLDGQETLTRLEMTDNYLGNTGAIELANALRRNKTLRAADLANNKICDEGGLSIADMLAQNCSLQQLSLRQNNIKEAGDAIAERLRQNTALLELDFAFNDFSFKSYSAVALALQRNNRLWKSQAAPRLITKIDALKGDEAALYGTEEEILQEIKKREATQESLGNKRETNRRTIANLKRQVREHEEELQGRAMECAKENELMAARGDELQKEKQKIENKKRRAETKVKDEENKIARIKKEQKKIEDDIKAFTATEEEELKPLLREHGQAKDAYTYATNEVDKVSAELSDVELQIVKLSGQNTSGDTGLAPPGSPKGGKSPAGSRRPSSAGRRGSGKKKK